MTLSPLALRVLVWAQAQQAAHVQGGLHPYGRFRSPDIDDYMAAAGLPNPTAVGAQGEPWCAAAVHYGYAECETPAQPSACPRTAGALRMAAEAPAACKLAGPAPGAVFILDRGHGHGHVGVVEVLGPLPGQITTVEPDTNASVSTTGDAWGRHTWEPGATGPDSRGTVVGYYDFGVTP